jgi:hypothetical protein
MLNGNIGVMKSMLAELTDETNMARGFSLIPVIWAVGGTIGYGTLLTTTPLANGFDSPRPFIGGVLARPQDRWPNVFSHPFWAEFPYFLPCLACAAYALFSFVMAAVFLKEVGCHPQISAVQLYLHVIQTVDYRPLTTKFDPIEVNSGIPRGGTCEILEGSLKDEEEKPLPLSSLFTRPVLTSVANYGMIGLLEMAVTTLLPLIWSTSVEFGGLGMSPVSIGLWMAGYGTLNGILQYVAFPRIVGRFGPRRIFITSIIAFVPIYLMFPFENLTLRSGSGACTLWVLIMLQLGSISISDMGFSTCPPIHYL